MDTTKYIPNHRKMLNYQLKKAKAENVAGHRRMLNQQLTKAREAFKKAVVDGVIGPELATIEEHLTKQSTNRRTRHC